MNDDTRAHVPDYDHMPVGALHHRIRSLDGAELHALRDYEATHAARPGVLTMIDKRLKQLARGPSTVPQPRPRT